MNMPERLTFSAAQIIAAQITSVRMLDGLAVFESDPAMRLARLARTFMLPVMCHERLCAMTADFAVLCTEQAQRFGCIALRDRIGILWLVLEDPFGRPQVNTIARHIHEPIRWALASHEDMSLHLARHAIGMGCAGSLSDACVAAIGCRGGGRGLRCGRCEDGDLSDGLQADLAQNHEGTRK